MLWEDCFILNIQDKKNVIETFYPRGAENTEDKTLVKHKGHKEVPKITKNIFYFSLYDLHVHVAVLYHCVKIWVLFYSKKSLFLINDQFGIDKLLTFFYS